MQFRNRRHNNLQYLYFNCLMIKEVIVLIFIAIFLGLSQTAGVGGGPIVNILLMMSMGYNTKLSISITYIFLIGGSIASLWKNSTKINPQTHRSYVSLDLILLTLPIMSSGSLFGGIIKNFVSEMIITILFIALFLFLIYDLRKTLKKMKVQSDASLIAIKSVINVQSTDLKQKLMHSVEQVKQKILNSNDKVKYTVKLCFGFYIFTVVIYLLRGGSHFDSIIGIDSCGIGGWIILFVHLGASLYLSYMLANSIIEQNQNRKEQQKNKYDVEVNQDNVWFFLTAGFFAGMVGAMLAIGGALILIPVWLKAGVDKDVAASSTATLILTAAMVAFTVALANGIYEDVSVFVMLFYLVLSFVSAAVVKDILVYVSNKYKLKSLVVVLLLIVVVISLVGMVPYQFSKMADDYQDFVQFGELC